jgi:hypothetical protein
MVEQYGTMEVQVRKDFSMHWTDCDKITLLFLPAYETTGMTAASIVFSRS